MQFSRGFKGVWIVPLVVAADRVTKAWALRRLAGAGRVSALPGWINWFYAENTGAAFSALHGLTGLVTLLTALLVIAVCVFLLVRPDEPAVVRAGLWMLAAGGAGNLFDRIAYGYVVDFIELDFVNFAIFNVADVFICVGAALAVLGYFAKERGKERQNG